MFIRFPHRTDCDRIRELASRDLDGDLTELDAVAVRTHVHDCAACTEFVAAMGQVTYRLRGADRLEAPGARPAVVSARSRRRSRLFGTAAAIAATAAAAGAGAVVASHAQHGAQRTAHTQTIAELAPLDHQFRTIREGKLLLVLPPPRVRSPHRRGILV